MLPITAGINATLVSRSCIEGKGMVAVRSSNYARIAADRASVKLTADTAGNCRRFVFPNEARDWRNRLSEIEEQHGYKRPVASMKLQR
jgi:hypothetical protein